MNMDINYAKGLVKNYANNQWQFINQVFAKDDIKDARCVWLNLAELKAFIAQIENAPAAGPGPATGIRVYFGAYSQVQPHPQQNYDRLHTLLMLPTVVTNDGKNTDYDAATGSFDFSTVESITALNHGTLTPPPYTVAGNSNMYNQGNTFMAYADSFQEKI